MRRFFILFTLVSLLLAVGITAARPNDCQSSIDYLKEGKSSFLDHDYVAAYNAYNCVIEAEPDNYEAILLRGEAGLLANFLTDEMPRTLQSYALVSDYAPHIIDEALADYSELIEANPDDPTYVMLRAFLLWYGTRDDEAMADYERVIDLLPDNPFGYLFRGSSYQYMGEWDAATASFDEAVELNPEENFTYVIIGETYMNTRDYAMVVDYMTEGMEHMPKGSSLYELRSRAYARMGEFEAGIEDITYAIELRPEAIDWLGSRAAMWVELGEMEAALDDLNQLMSHETYEPEIQWRYFLRRSDVLNVLGQTEAAAEDLLAYLQLTNSRYNPEVEFRVGRSFAVDMQSGVALQLEFDVEAGEMIDIIAESDENNATVLDMMAVLVGPDGNALVGSDNPTPVTPFTIDPRYEAVIERFEAPQDGTYTLYVRASCGCEGTAVIDINIR